MGHGEIPHLIRVHLRTLSAGNSRRGQRLRGCIWQQNPRHKAGLSLARLVRSIEGHQSAEQETLDVETKRPPTPPLAGKKWANQLGISHDSIRPCRVLLTVRTSVSKKQGSSRFESLGWIPNASHNLLLMVQLVFPIACAHAGEEMTPKLATQGEVPVSAVSNYTAAQSRSGSPHSGDSQGFRECAVKRNLVCESVDEQSVLVLPCEAQHLRTKSRPHRSSRAVG